MWNFESNYLSKTRAGNRIGMGVAPRTIELLENRRVLACAVPDYDFDSAGTIDANDIELLSQAVRDASVDLTFDVNGDGLVSQADRLRWLQDCESTYGDTNIDGTFDFDDSDNLNVNDAYEMNVNATWEEGDFNGDARFDRYDVISTLQVGGFSESPPPLTSLPMPTLQRLFPNGADGDGQMSVEYIRESGDLIVRMDSQEVGSVYLNSRTNSFITGHLDPADGLNINSSEAIVRAGDDDVEVIDVVMRDIVLPGILAPGMSVDEILAEVSIVGSRFGGGELGPVDLIYVGKDYEDLSDTHVLLDRLGENERKEIRFEVEARGRLSVDAFFHDPTPESPESGDDVELRLLDFDRKLLATSSSKGNYEHIHREVVAGEVYFIEVFEFDDRGQSAGSEFQLSVHVIPEGPRIYLLAEEDGKYVISPRSTADLTEISDSRIEMDLANTWEAHDIEIGPDGILYVSTTNPCPNFRCDQPETAIERYTPAGERLEPIALPRRSSKFKTVYFEVLEDGTFLLAEGNDAVRYDWQGVRMESTMMSAPATTVTLSGDIASYDPLLGEDDAANSRVSPAYNGGFWVSYKDDDDGDQFIRRIGSNDDMKLESSIKRIVDLQEQADGTLFLMNRSSIASANANVLRDDAELNTDDFALREDWDNAFLGIAFAVSQAEFAVPVPSVLSRSYEFSSLVDSDGDGIPNDWETDGIPVLDENGQQISDDDGLVYYKLPNADPYRKDIYLELDAFAGMAPSPSAIFQVIQMFDNVPSIPRPYFLEQEPAVIYNPTSSTNDRFEGVTNGIGLHVDEFFAGHSNRIGDLYNTGVDDGHALLNPEESMDSHYCMVPIQQSDSLGCNGFSMAYAGVSSSTSEFPLAPAGGWQTDNDSAWISPTENSIDSATANRSVPTHIYRTTFTIPSDADLSTVWIAGNWSTDSRGVDILLNGQSTGFENLREFISESHFYLDGTSHPFSEGENQLDFVVSNYSENMTQAYIGLRVEMRGGYRDPNFQLSPDLLIAPEDISVPRVFAEGSTSAWESFHKVRAAHYGISMERSVNHAEQILAAKDKVYRYALFGDERGENGMSGLADQPGRNLLVTLGGWSEVTAFQQAAALAHELGHTLGLDHGGDDSLNHKPNNISIMNYSFFYETGLIYATNDVTAGNTRFYEQPFLDFSRFSSDLRSSHYAVQALDESNWQPNLELRSDVAYQFPADVQDGQYVEILIISDNPFNLGDEIDVNKNARSGELLKSYNDWANLQLSVRDTHDSGDGGHDKPSKHPLRSACLDAAPSYEEFCLVGDVFEENDSADESFPVEIEEIDEEVSIHTLIDVDWFEIISIAGAVLDIVVSSEHSLDVEVYGDQNETTEPFEPNTASLDNRTTSYSIEVDRPTSLWLKIKPPKPSEDQIDYHLSITQSCTDFTSTTWTNSSDDSLWSNPANWNNGIPDACTTAAFNDVGGDVDFAGQEWFVGAFDFQTNARLFNGDVQMKLSPDGPTSIHVADSVTATFENARIRNANPIVQGGGGRVSLDNFEAGPWEVVGSGFLDTHEDVELTRLVIGELATVQIWGQETLSVVQSVELAGQLKFETIVNGDELFTGELDIAITKGGEITFLEGSMLLLEPRKDAKPRLAEKRVHQLTSLIIAGAINDFDRLELPEPTLDESKACRDPARVDRPDKTIARIDIGQGQFVEDRIEETGGEISISIYQAGPGDSNGDGCFDTADLIQVFQAGEFEDNHEENSVWAEGDWNLDKEFGTGDLISAFQNGLYLRSAIAAVRMLPNVDPRPKIEARWDHRRAGIPRPIEIVPKKRIDPVYVDSIFEKTVPDDRRILRMISNREDGIESGANRRWF